MTKCEVTLSSSDFLAGDLLRATVAFHGQEETLDWAAVQVHGHCWHDNRLVASTTFESPPSSPKSLRVRKSTSFEPERKTSMPDMSKWIEGTICLFATKPHCLAAEVPIEGYLCYTFEASLPPVLPPSFRGVSAKYVYLLTICAKLRSEQSARVAHIPFHLAGTPGSLGDGAKVGPASSFFLEGVNGANKKRLPSASEEEEELIVLQSQNGDGLYAEYMKDHINSFPRKYDNWDSSVRSVSQGINERVWFLERDEGEEELSYTAGASTGKRYDPPYDSSEGHVKAINAQTAKGRLAKCYISPCNIIPGDTLSIRLDLSNVSERSRQISASIELEERSSGPPPVVAAFEPLLRKRQGSGPWTKTLSSKTINVSLCSSCAFSISTYGVPPDFSTDLIMVHSYLKLEFTTETMVCSLRIPLNVRTPPRSTRIISLVSEIDRSTSPSPVSPFVRRMEEQSPPPKPKKKLVF